MQAEKLSDIQEQEEQYREIRAQEVLPLLP
jgi:hypothetical protein